MPANHTWFRSFYLIIFCCFITACNNSVKHAAAKKEADLYVLTDNITAIGDPRKVLPYIDSVFNAQKSKTPYLRAGRLMAYANYYYRIGLYPKGVPYIDSATAILDVQNLNDTSWTEPYCSAYNLKGSILNGMSNYKLAMDSYFKVKEFAEKADNACRIMNQVNNSIGHILYKQQKYEDAKKYFKMALRQLLGCSAIKYKVNAEQELLDNIALCFSKQNNADSGLAYYRKALYEIAKRPNNFSADPMVNKDSRETAQGIVYGNIAQILVKQNKLDSAELLFKRNIALNGIRFKAARKDAQLSQMYLADLYNLRQQYPKMKLMLADLRQNLDTLKNDKVELGWRRLMAEYYSKNNLPLEQIKYYDGYISLKDSLDEAQMAVNEADITQEFKAQSAQLEIKLLQKDNQLSHLYLWITIWLSLMALIIVALVYYYYRQGKKNIRTLTMLNSEIGEQKDKLEFAVVELEKSNTDKERILRVVAHDLRDPIGGAATLINTVINEVMPDEYEKQSLNLVEKTLANSLMLINELVELDLGKEHILLNKELTDINETVKHCAALMQLIAAKKSQKVQSSTLPKPLNVYIDSDKIERMLNNLIGNAIKFSPAGETIGIELERKDKAVLIAVKDNGIGVPPQLQTEVFNTLGATRRAGTAGEKSFGLGLSICRQIAEAHNGRIWVQSEPGSGSNFYVELPL